MFSQLKRTLYMMTRRAEEAEPAKLCDFTTTSLATSRSFSARGGRWRATACRRDHGGGGFELPVGGGMMGWRAYHRTLEPSC
jgi:hypothetical protein